MNAIDACKADGTMRLDIDPQTLIDAIVGTYIAERAREGQVGDDWEDRPFAVFWPAVRTDAYAVRTAESGPDKDIPHVTRRVIVKWD